MTEVCHKTNKNPSILVHKIKISQSLALKINFIGFPTSDFYSKFRDPSQLFRFFGHERS